jgi:hypothetical protein
MNDTASTPRAAPSGPVLWFATFASPATWLIHLVAEASLVRLHEQHPPVVWLMHGLTVVLALVVLLGMRISWSYAHIAGDDEGVATPAGRTVFLGWVGLVIGALSLLLIVYEGLLVSLIDTGHL